MRKDTCGPGIRWERVIPAREISWFPEPLKPWQHALKKSAEVKVSWLIGWYWPWKPGRKLEGINAADRPLELS